MHGTKVVGLTINRWSPARFWSAPVFWRFSYRGEPTESARGLAQSKTLPRGPQVHGPNACGKNEKGLSMKLGNHIARSARKISGPRGMDACAPGRVTEMAAAATAN